MTRIQPKKLLIQKQHIESLPLPKVQQCSNLQAVSSSFGLLNQVFIFAGDKLRLGKPEEGDLLLLEPSHEVTRLLYPSIMFARLCGEHILLELPHQPTIERERWRIVGAIKGLVRPLAEACVGDGYWRVRVLGADGWVNSAWLDMIHSQPLDAIYVSELAKELSAIPDVSIQAARTLESLEAMPIPDSGTILFSFHSAESPSLFASDWEAGSRRRMRLKRMQKRLPKETPRLYPLPNIHENIQIEEASSSDRVIPFGGIACK